MAGPEPVAGEAPRTALPSTARVVIIGGGAVGASAAYHLAKAGWSDVLLLEKNELTAGSTWHAAGNVPTFSASWGIMNIQAYSTELYRGLAQEVDYPMNYHVTGSIRLAHSGERMQEFERVRGMGQYRGMGLEMCSVADLKERYPFMETHDLEGGLWDPNDGDIDPAQLTQALAKGARNHGAKIVRFCPATGLRRENDEWVVETAKGEVRAEVIVNAAGYYAQRVAEWYRPYAREGMGRRLPMMVMSHQYLLTEEIPEIEAWSKEAGRKLPLLRDVDSSYYLRQEKYGLNLGPYENTCRGHWLGGGDDPADPMPDDFSFQLWDDDLDRIAWHIEDACARVPLLGEGGVSRVINGPIPYTPDGNPLIGPVPGVPNAFEACVFTFGICQAGGAGKVLSEWIIEGGTEQDMWAVDPRRFTAFASAQDYADAKGMEVYGNEYAMHFPHHEWPAARDRKRSPLHERIVELGGVMGAYNGWERANWFAKPGDDTSEQATHTWARSGPWETRVREEVEAVRDGCGVLDLPGFSRFRLTGADAAAWLDRQITGKLPKVGRVSLGYFADEKGRIVTEMSITRSAEDRFYLITAATAQWHDMEWLRRHLEPDLDVSLEDVTEGFDTLIVTGPKSREVLSQVLEGDWDLPWLTRQETTFEGKWVALMRVSFAGELGWELHVENDTAPALHEAVLAAGAKPFGMFALNSMRLEKGYRAWKGDLSTDYTVLSGGLSRFIDWAKDDFRGKAALENERQQGSARSFATLKVNANGCDAPYMANVWHGDEIVGEVTSGGYGYRVDSSIALASVRTDLAEAGTELEVEIFGDRRPAKVAEGQALWDPKNERLRA